VKKLSPTQQQVLDAMKAGATLHTGRLNSGDYLVHPDRRIENVRSTTFTALVQAKVIKRRGSVWDQVWVAA
jgi:hypothetical protein